MGFVVQRRGKNKSECATKKIRKKTNLENIPKLKITDVMFQPLTIQIIAHLKNVVQTKTRLSSLRANSNFLKPPPLKKMPLNPPHPQK